MTSVAGTPFCKNVALLKKLFGSDTLLRGDKEVPLADAFDADCKAIGLYFSAHWCPPCRGFTPKLAVAYEDSLEEKGMEIVFVSSDKDQAQFESYYKKDHGEWLALPFAAREGKAALSKLLKVGGIPTFAVLDGQTGALITDEGREKVSEDPTGGADFPAGWAKAPAEGALDILLQPGAKLVKQLADPTAAQSSREEVDAAEALKGKTVGIYFSAHWCPPCRQFTPKLAEMYKAMSGPGGAVAEGKFEIVFASSDRDASSFAGYFDQDHGDWLALPFNDTGRDQKARLSTAFEVRGIPSFIVVGPDGKVLNANARGAVMGDPTGAAFPWLPPAMADVDGAGPDGINEEPSLVLLLDDCKDADRAALAAALEGVATAARAAQAAREAAAAATAGAGPKCIVSLEDGGDGAGKNEPVTRFFTTGNAGPADGSQLAERIRSLIKLDKTGAPQMVVLDLADNGGYYVSDAAPTDANIATFIADFEAKKLERKQLG